MAQLVSFFPATAPFAMPIRIAMGATAWWEPIGAAALMLITIAGLVEFGGRVYAGRRIGSIEGHAETSRAYAPPTLPAAPPIARHRGTYRRGLVPSPPSSVMRRSGRRA